jgi:hypothetical protein
MDSYVFGIIASLFILVGFFPYIRDIYRKNVQPHVLSWLGWGFITALGASAMWAEGSGWIAVIVFANSFSCFSVVTVSLLRKVGVWQTTKLDWFLFFCGDFGVNFMADIEHANHCVGMCDSC